MLKKENGVTMVALAITIVVMLIIITVTYVTGTDLLDSSKIKGYITTMYLVKGEVSNMNESYEFDGDTSHLKGKRLDVNDPTVKARLTEIYQNEIVDGLSASEKAERLSEISDSQPWYILEKEDIHELGIENNMQDKGEVFIVNYSSEVIIYSSGYTKDGKVIYSLDGLLKLK